MSRGGRTYHERLRGALARYEQGVHHLGDPAPARDLEEAERVLGAPLDPELRSFLVSWNGAELFQDAQVLFGVGTTAVGGDLTERTRAFRREGGDPETLWIGQSAAGDRYLLAPGGTVIVVEADSGEEWTAASDYARLPELLLEREGALHDREGEYRADVFDEDEVRPEVIVRRARRLLRIDPGADRDRFDLADALLRLGKTDEGRAELEALVAREPGCAWAHHRLGRIAEEPGQASSCFEAAAEADERRGGDQAAFFLAEAARAARAAGDEARAEGLAARALEQDPAAVAHRLEAAALRLEEGFPEDAVELVELALALRPTDLQARALLERARAPGR